MNKQEAAKDNWIKVPLKNHPGRYYLFDRTTGEKQSLLPYIGSKRISSNDKNAPKSGSSPPKVLSPKIKKTPAQDRLKRLQHTLNLEHLKSDAKRCSRRFEADTRKDRKDVVKNEEPSTSRLTSRGTSICKENSMASLTNRAMKEQPSISRLNSVESPTSGASKLKSFSSVTVNKKSQDSSATVVSSRKQYHTSRERESSASPVISRKRHNTSDNRSPVNIKSIKMEPPRSDCHQKTENVAPLTSSTPQLPQNADDATQKTDVPSTSGMGIFAKLKEILTSSFSTFMPQTNQAYEEIEEQPNTSSHLKKEQKGNQEQNILNKSLESQRPQQLKMELPDSDRKFKTPSIRKSRMCLEATRSDRVTRSTASTNHSPNNVGFKPGSANSRLARLRQSLMLQQQSSTTGPPINALALLVPVSNALNLPTTSFNFALNCAFQLNNKNYRDNDGIEAMDWQTIEKTDAEGPKPSGIKQNTAETMGEIYDTVGENLFRMSAENNRGRTHSARRWLKDYYYFVVDTNVLLRCLSFLEDIRQMKLCETQGSILFVPYSVLQELDKLKMRNGAGEGPKTLAVRAIKYLNNKFENKDLHIQAQTASEERVHKIDVNSADDSIINCCLQVKEHVRNMVLLTEDVNLRNKAICNDIVATTKADLLHKQYVNAK